MQRIERTDHLTKLSCETVEAMGVTCSECGGTARGDTLQVYATVRGRRVRTHNGSFCSKLCHDIFHGLRPRK